LQYLKGGLPQDFGNSMREFALSISKKNLFTFIEVLDGSGETDIARFIGRNTSAASDLAGVDAALDYPLYNSKTNSGSGRSAKATQLRSEIRISKPGAGDQLSILRKWMLQGVWKC
jgi:hypothetical protein